MATRKMKHGFTLVELIVVIAIIGVLAAILVPLLSGYLQKSKRSALEGDTKQVYTNIVSTMADAEAANIDPGTITASAFKGKISDWTKVKLSNLTAADLKKSKANPGDKIDTDGTKKTITLSYTPTGSTDAIVSTIGLGSLLPDKSGVGIVDDNKLSPFIYGENAKDAVIYVDGTTVAKSW